MNWLFDDNEPDNTPKPGTIAFELQKRENRVYDLNDRLRRVTLERNDFASRLAKTELLLSQVGVERDELKRACYRFVIET